MKILSLVPLFLAASCATAPATPRIDAPLVDYHQHLVSAAFEPVVKLPRRDAVALLAEMDRAGVRQAVVLSVGYSFADERKQMADPDRLTREENDWTSAQVASARSRLIGFCSANPLRDAALAEIERCLALKGMRGIKLHMGNAGVTLRNPDHVRRLQQMFDLAQRKKAPLMLHMRPRGGADYDARDVRIFLDQIMPHAPSIPVIVAHLGASSPGYPAQNDEIMGAFAEAAARRDPRMANLYFDPSANVNADTTPAEGAKIATRTRQIGVAQFLYGSDLSAPGGSIGAGWTLFRTHVSLTPAELAIIAGQRLPFMR